MTERDCHICWRRRPANEFLELIGTKVILPICKFCRDGTLNRADLMKRTPGEGVSGTIKVSDALELRSGDLAGKTVSDTLARKRADSSYPELLESIRRNGILVPVLIRRGHLMNGHHRVAALVDLEITEVAFTDDIKVGWDR